MKIRLSSDYNGKGRLNVTAQNLRGFRFDFVLAVTLALTMLIISGCSDKGSSPVAADPPTTTPPQQTLDVSFQTHVRPIFQSFGCTSCHGGSGGLTVTSVAQLLNGGDHGPAIVAGKPESSVLISKLSANPPFGSRMPQGGPYLPDSTVQKIRLWIAQGAKDN